MVKHRSNSTRQPGEAYTAKEELKVLKLLVQVVGRHFLFLGLSIAMGDQSAGVQSWGGRLFVFGSLYSDVFRRVYIPVLRGVRVSVQSVASYASGKKTSKTAKTASYLV